VAELVTCEKINRPRDLRIDPELLDHRKEIAGCLTHLIRVRSFASRMLHLGHRAT
jgi:hypothetical protein